MSCEEFSEEFELYAMGALDAEEEVRVREHLETGCARCGAQLRKAMSLNAVISAGVAEVEPPRRLRTRVVETLTGSRKVSGWNWTWATAAASLLVAAVWLWEGRREAGRELAGMRRLLEAEQSKSENIRAALAVLSDPGTRLATAGKAEPQPRARYFLNEKRGVVLLASNLAAVPAGRIYEMWIIPKGQAPRPAGLFRPDAQGNAVHYFETPVEVGGTAALAVTVEPESGSPAPTTQPMLVAPVTGL